MTDRLSESLSLPCGATLSNRLVKSAMTEGIADALNRATPGHATLYKRWSEGGAGLLLTGNVQVDRRYLERPGNVVIEDGPDLAAGLDGLRAFAAAGTAAGNHLWMQIGHAGRQTPIAVNPEPVAPSAVPMELPPGRFGDPRALTGDEVEDVVRRFAFVAGVARDTGFTGVQIHAAHGYLISEFLSPKANRRDDTWGGPLENRARLLREAMRAMRRTVGRDFPIGVKLNSADFQQGGFTFEECKQVVRWLEADGCDLLEISGGNYEQPSMMGARAKQEVDANAAPVRESTRRREAYFLDYAAAMREVTAMPLLVTGGFRTGEGMQDALASGALDVVGLARPLCSEPDIPARLLAGERDAARSDEKTIDPPQAGLAWFCLQIIRLAEDKDADLDLAGRAAIKAYAAYEADKAAALKKEIPA